MINGLLYPYMKADCPLHLGLPKCTLTNVEGKCDGICGKIVFLHHSSNKINCPLLLLFFLA